MAFGRLSRTGALSGVVLLASSLLATVLLGAAPRSRADQQTTEATQLTALAERLLLQPYYQYGPTSSADAEPTSARLLPGQVPTDLPLNIPIPAGGRLVGSLTRTGGPTVARSIEVVIDAPGSTREIQQFYERAFDEFGWKAPNYGGYGPYSGGGGFQPQAPMTGGFFCQSDDGGAYATLMIYPVRSNGGTTDVRLSVSLPSVAPASPPSGMYMPYGRAYGPCSVSSAAGPVARPAPPRNPLPPLAPPTGVRLQPTGGGGGMNSWSSDAVAQTDAPSADLASIFGDQLAAAGWTQLDGGADGPLAWSTWELPDERSWEGLLFVIDPPGDNRRALSVRASDPSANATSSFGPAGYTFMSPPSMGTPRPPSILMEPGGAVDSE